MAYSEGEFLADVLGAVLTEAKTGTPQVMVEFRLAEGPDAGQRISDYMAVSDAALKYTVPKLRTCGWKGDDLDDLSSINGGQVRLVLRAEEYNGRMWTRIAFVNQPKPPALDTEKAKSVGREWREKIAALAKGEAAPF